MQKLTKSFGLTMLLVISLVMGGLPAALQNAVPRSEASENSPIDQILAEMTVRQKVGQLLVVNLGGRQLSEAQAAFLATYQPGAFVVFGSNVEGRPPSEITEYINSLQITMQDNEALPMLIATDHEGGRVQRLLEGFTHFPEPSILGASADPEIARLVGGAMGRELSAVGINMNLAPVADLHTRADMLNTSRVLNHRTISQDPEVVGEIVAGLATGFADYQVIGVAKHFPGHSPTDTDTHVELATVLLDLETAVSQNLRPFQIAIDNGIPVIMLGHLYYPALDEIERPATLSPVVISRLREDMGFDGVIMTDALDMGAIVNLMPTPEASVEAFLAGVDMLTMGPGTSIGDQVASLEALYAAVEGGRVSMERLDASVRRILQLKLDYGVLAWQALDPATTTERMGLEQSSQALVRLFEAGITIVRDEQNALPLQPEDNVAVIYPVGKPRLFETCQQYLPNAVYQSYSWWPYDWEFGATQSAARNADIVVVIAENISWNTPQGEIVQGLPLEKVLYVSLWKPYEWEYIEGLNPETPGFLATYSTWEEAQIALCRVLSGQVPARGQLPMPINGYDLGWGLQYESINAE